MNDAEKLKLCSGCRNDFYNDKNGLGVKRCWSLETAEKVKRYRIGWWVPQDSAENFQKVTTLSCYQAPGTAAFYRELPEHLRTKPTGQAPGDSK